jgi:hypothetical protein
VAVALDAPLIQIDDVVSWVDFGDWWPEQWAPIVVVEGITCCRRAASGSLAYSIRVDAPAELCLERGIERDRESHRHRWERWMFGEEAFSTSDGTRERVDLIVSGHRSTLEPEHETERQR